MATVLSESSVSKKANVIGWILSILPCLLMLMSAAMKFIKPAGFADGLEHMGWQESSMTIIGVVEILIIVIYLIPKTSILGAILIVAYLGGAVATHVRVEEGAFPVIFAAIFGVLVWVGLYLRDPLVRALLPLRK